MAKIIGIPRGLDYYLLYPFWQAFFTRLGLETVVSPPTNKGILDLGAANAVDGCCLPVKSYLGHVLTLAEQGITHILVPQAISIARREYICPYFLGLPDFIAHYLPKKGLSLVSPVIDLRRGEAAAARKLISFGAQYGSWRDALEAYFQARAALERWRRGRTAPTASEQRSVLVLGHPYLLADSFFSQGVLCQLQKAGLEVVTPYHFPEAVLKKAAQNLQKRMFWTSGRQSLGALEHCLGKVEGIIALAAFACGTDSLVSDLIQRRARQAGVPCLLLNVDEHTGEAGTVTRVEAFLDMLARRKTR